MNILSITYIRRQARIAGRFTLFSKSTQCSPKASRFYRACSIDKPRCIAKTMATCFAPLRHDKFNWREIRLRYTCSQFLKGKNRHYLSQHELLPYSVFSNIFHSPWKPCKFSSHRPAIQLYSSSVFWQQLYYQLAQSGYLS